MKNKIKLVKPNKFVIKIAGCGVDTCRANFEKMEDESALKLALRVNQIMAEQFVRDKNSASFLYDVAVCILGCLVTGWKEDDLKRNISNYEKILEGWSFKKEIKQNLKDFEKVKK